MLYTQSKGYRTKKGFVAATVASDDYIWLYNTSSKRWEVYDDNKRNKFEVACPCRSVRAFRRLMKAWRAQGDLPKGIWVYLCHEEGDIYVAARV